MKESIEGRFLQCRQLLTEARSQVSLKTELLCSFEDNVLAQTEVGNIGLNLKQEADKWENE